MEEAYAGLLRSPARVKRAGKRREEIGSRVVTGNGRGGDLMRKRVAIGWLKGIAEAGSMAPFGAAGSVAGPGPDDTLARGKTSAAGVGTLARRLMAAERARLLQEKWSRRAALMASTHRPRRRCDWQPEQQHSNNGSQRR